MVLWMQQHEGNSSENHFDGIIGQNKSGMGWRMKNEDRR